MKPYSITAMIAIGILILGQNLCLSSPKEIEPGTWLEDFDDGKLDQWELTGKHAEVEQENGNSVLELGDSQLWFKGGKFKDFSIEARVRRDYKQGGNVGFIFRDNYQVCIGMIGEVKLTGPANAKARGLTRGLGTDTYRTLKVVCTGPVARFYVDGKYEGEFNGLSVEPGRIGLFGGNSAHNVYFDDVKIQTHVETGQYLLVEPKAQELVFSPKEDIKLALNISNFSESKQDVALGITVQSWTGQVIKAVNAPATTLNPGENREMTVDLGKLLPGFHKMLVKPTELVLPLAVQERGAGECRPPDIIVGVYWAYRHWDLPAVWWKTYVHAAARQLSDNHFNAVVSFIGMPAETIDILQQYGIVCLSRGEHMDHPAVLGAFISDEPRPEDVPALKEQYTKLHEKYPGKILTTCMIGDNGLKGHVFDTWKELAPFGQVRMFRWYGIKKSWEGINRQRGDRPTFIELLRTARQAEGPYWIILPSFGVNSAESFYGNPLPSELKAMMHLSVANNAQGIFFYTYQTDSIDDCCYVGAETLVPTDEKWAAAGDVAGQIAQHAALLKSLKCGGMEPYIDNYAVEGFRLGDGTNQYIYVINKDPQRTVDFRLFKLEAKGALWDVYADKKVEINQETVELLRPGIKIETGVARLQLGPGDGTLLRYSVQGDKAPVAAPRVKYPEAVAKTPEEKCVYLIDLKTENTPMPGWVERGDYKKNAWTNLNGDTRLFAGQDDPGQVYKKSLYAQAETEIVYRIPEGCATFVAAMGLGTKSAKSSVIFRVVVDGKEKYRSEIYRLGTPVLPVVVDIAGAKELKLVTEEAGDGIYQDYAWWGEARLIKK